MSVGCRMIAASRGKSASTNDGMGPADNQLKGFPEVHTSDAKTQDGEVSELRGKLADALQARTEAEDRLRQLRLSIDSLVADQVRELRASEARHDVSERRNLEEQLLQAQKM